MKSAVVLFPGINRERDMARALEAVTGHKPVIVWHTETTLPKVDLVAKWMLGPRMCVTGLIEQKDISGLTIHAKAQQAIVPNLAHDHTPNPWVQQMIGGGDLGLKTGRGFYDWANCDAKAVGSQAAQRVEAVLTFLKQMQTNTAPATTPKPRPEHRGDSR